MEYKVTAREELFILGDLTFRCIFGTHFHGAGAYVAIVNWGVSAELSASKSDAIHNGAKILVALQHSSEKCWLPCAEKERWQIARNLGQMITERIQEIRRKHNA